MNEGLKSIEFIHRVLEKYAQFHYEERASVHQSTFPADPSMRVWSPWRSHLEITPVVYAGDGDIADRWFKLMVEKLKERART